MDTDLLLQPLHVEDDAMMAWKDVVRANTAAWKEVRKDLDDCNNVDKVRAIMAKVEKAMEDLSVDSQKVPQWVRDAQPKDSPTYGVPPYGQYPVIEPLNRDNPVPRAASPVVTGNIKNLTAIDQVTASIEMPPGHYSRFANGDLCTISGTNTPADGAQVELANGDGRSFYQCALAVTQPGKNGLLTKGG